ncbi:hypothetical protein FSP39_009652 [Pinctada imbricata]|uniref:Ubiquitin carboxyl-terminal hydrolase n=1 Tax=Pinctada imbricata TaxID=66713 RepID=A0AA88YI23_PINIB|nr:hypothetical protein FSP39_009652 [Pinctada imbricata]
MDAILNGILTSSYPDKLKKQLIQKIAANGANPQPVAVIQSVLELTSKWYLNGETDLAQSQGLSVYLAWARYNLRVLETFFSREFLLELLQLKCHNEGSVFILIKDSMTLLQQSAVFSAHLQVLEAKAISYVRDHPSTPCLKNLAVFLEDFKQCIPKGDFASTFCISLIQSLSLCTVPDSPQDVIEYIRDVERVCKLVFNIWNSSDSENIIIDSLKAIFAVISDSGDNKPSFCLAAVVQFVPNDMIDRVVKFTIQSSVDDRSMTVALQRIVDWLQWPTAKNIDQWIVIFLRALASVKKFSILIAVTDSKIEQVCEKLQFSAMCEPAFNVLEHMLLSFQHSPEPFHKVLPMIPGIVETLRADNSERNTSCLQRLASLLHCCMFLHAGYPDLYDPILEAVKGLPEPQTSEIKDILSKNRWTAQNLEGTNYVTKVTQKSETGKTGLYNLGNTCYMNSVLQALYMCDGFRRGVMAYSPSPDEKLLEQLQLVFAYLGHTQRPAYAPMTFSRVSRPSWFTAGHQQDCSEYLRFLLDQLHEQEKATCKGQKVKRAKGDDGEPTSVNGTNSESATVANGDDAKIRTLIDQGFGGQLATTYTCLTCGHQSSRKEDFTDLPLAFPEYRPVGCPSEGKDKDDDGKKENGDVESEENKSKSSTEIKSLHLNDLLQYYLKPERLSGDNKYFCEKCNSLQDGERTLDIISAPDCLILTLLRFSYDVKLQSRSKNFREVKYPKTMILPTMQKQVSELGKTNPRHSLRAAVMDRLGKFGLELNTEKGEVYSLNAVVVHSGTSSDHGHYYAYARHSIFCDPHSICDTMDDCKEEDELDFLQDKWYLFNDNRVSYAKYSSFSNVTKRFTKDTAYVLIYKRIDPSNAEKSEVDLNSSIHPREVDPPLSSKLRTAVSKDNGLYLQEQELSAKKRTARKRQNVNSASWYNYKDPDDNDKGPPGSCGGSSGFNNSGPRFVF